VIINEINRLKIKNLPQIYIRKLRGNYSKEKAIINRIESSAHEDV